MSGYEQFMATGEPDSENILWQLTFDDSKVENMIDFVRSFIVSEGFEFSFEKINNFLTPIYKKDDKKYKLVGVASDGNHHAIKIQRIKETTNQQN